MNSNTNIHMKNKRVLGCAGWAIILSLAGTILINLSSLILNNFVRYWDARSSFSQFIFFLLPTITFSIIIGSKTRPGLHFFRSALIIVPIVVIIFSSYFYYGYMISAAISDVPTNESFWHPVSNGIAIIIDGFVLGIIASYGYWHAGKKDKSEQS